MSRLNGRARRAAWRRGNRAEALACWFLRCKGYRILAAGYRTRVGEIDIIARRGRMLAFVEVKRRATIGDALAAMTPRQSQRVRRAADWFMKTHPQFSGTVMRFDMLALAPWRLPVHIAGFWRDSGTR